jgi:hypothetical protein
VWAFGVTAWELLTDGEVPFAFIASNEAIAERVCGGERLTRPGECPDALWALMLRMWAERPADRPTFVEVAEALVVLRTNLLAQNSSSIPSLAPDASDEARARALDAARVAQRLPSYNGLEDMQADVSLIEHAAALLFDPKEVDRLLRIARGSRAVGAARLD